MRFCRIALVRPREMFSLWAKERWDRDGLSFISKSVSRCFLVGILRFPSVVLLQGASRDCFVDSPLTITENNVQDVNLDKL